MGKILIGILLLWWGVSLLLERSGIMLRLPEIEWRYVWPVILIFAGLSLFEWRGVGNTILGLVITLAVAGLVLTALFRGESGFENRSFGRTVVSNELISENREVKDFDAIDISGIGEVYITQGNEEKLSIETDKRVMDLIKTEVSDRKLSIRYENDNWRNWVRLSTEKVKINIVVKNLKEINLSGAIKLDSGIIRSEGMKLNVSGAADSMMNIETGKLDSKVSGAAKMILKGKADEQKIELNGASSWDSLQLESNNTEVDISGAGKAKVWVNKNLKVKVSGGASVGYKGDPKVEEQISGAGKVEKIN